MPSPADSEIIFVDDGSTDGSVEVLRELSRNNPSVKAIIFRKNFGKTAAMQAAFTVSRGKYIITMDADAQNDPADIKKLLEKAEEGYDVVSGWRKKRKDPYFSRTLPSIIGNMAISAITGVKLHDFVCNLKCYRRDMLEGLTIYGEMHRFLPAYLAWKGAKVTEIEVNHRPRLKGRSHYGFERAYKFLLDMFVAKFFMSYLAKPVYFFGGIGILSLAAAILTGAFVIARRILWGGEWISPLIFVAFFMAGTAVICMLLGILAEILIRVYFDPKERITYEIKEKFNA